MKSYENSGPTLQTGKHHHRDSSAKTVAQLRQEAQELRARQRDYKALQDQVLALE